MKRAVHYFLLALIFPYYTFAQNADSNFRVAFKGIIPMPVKLAVQPDNKILIGGSINSVGSTPVLSIARMHPSGDIDSTFNLNLRIAGRINDILVQDDGKITIVGQDLGEQGDIIRLDKNGYFDPAFKLDSKLYKVGGVKIRQQANGKYIVGAFEYNNIFRLNLDGTLDPSFVVKSGFNGIGIDDFDIEIQEDQKILILGAFSRFNGHDVNKVIRLNPDASIDESFDIGIGPEQYGYPSNVSNMEIQSDGKIVLVGRFDKFNGKNAKNLVRLNYDGSIDDTFTLSTAIITSYPHGITSIKIMSNDQIIACGIDDTNIDLQFKVVVLQPNGSLNTSFSTGRLKIPIDVGAVYQPAIEVNADKEIFFAGAIESLNGIRRLGAAATDSMGNILDFNPSIGGLAEIKTIVQQEDGQLIVGGSFLGVDKYSVSNLVRIDLDGKIDEAFLENFGTGTDRSVNSLAIQSDGKILVGGGFNYVNNQSFRNLVRLEKDGSIDENFWTNIALTHINDGITTIHEQADGKIIIAGSFQSVNNVMRNNFARLKKDGSLDDSFNQSNFLTLNNEVLTCEIQSDGKVVLGGNNSLDGTGGFLYRVDTIGNIDPTFSHSLDLSNTSISKIEISENDNLFLGTNFSVSFPQNQYKPVYQLKKDGSLLDEYSIATMGGEVKDFLFLGNEEVIIAGNFSTVNNSVHYGLVKTSYTGNISTFNPQIVFNDASTGGSSVNTILRTDENTLIIGGEFNQIRNQFGFSGLAKISITNKTPQIIGVKKHLECKEDATIQLSLEDLIIEDDNLFPNDFTLTIANGENYSVVENTVKPNTNFHGNLTVPITVNDGLLESPVYNLTVHIIPVNDPPIITGITKKMEIPENSLITLSLTDLEVSDPDNVFPDDFTFTIADGENYSVVENTIKPDSNFYGNLTVPITVNDGLLESPVFNLTIKVVPNNFPPVIAGIKTAFETSENTPFSISVHDFEIEDSDNDFNDFQLIILEDEAYTVSDSTVTPKQNITGLMTVFISVCDGIDTSEVFLVEVTVNKVLGLNNSVVSKIEMYPNPVKNVLYIESDKNGKTTITATIFTLQGKIVFSEKLKPFQPVQLDLSKFEKGVYLLQVKDNYSSWFKKFVKE